MSADPAKALTSPSARATLIKEGITEASESHPDKGLAADKLLIAKNVIMTAKTNKSADPTHAPNEAERLEDAANVLEKISGPTI